MHRHAERPNRNKRFFPKKVHRQIQAVARELERERERVASQRKNPRRKPIEIFIASKEFPRLPPLVSYCIPTSRFEASHFSSRGNSFPAVSAWGQEAINIANEYATVRFHFEIVKEPCHNQKNRLDAREQHEEKAGKPDNSLESVYSRTRLQLWGVLHERNRRVVKSVKSVKLERYDHIDPCNRSS